MCREKYFQKLLAIGPGKSRGVAPSEQMFYRQSLLHIGKQSKFWKVLQPVGKYLGCHVDFIGKFSFCTPEVFYKDVFLLSTETSVSFSQFQYQNVLKTFLAKIVEFQCFAHVQ